MTRWNLGIIFLILLIISSENLFAQSPGRAYFRIEKVPGELTKSINVWGYVTLPGRYEVPIETNLLQLITYAGGPREYAVMDEIKIYRLREDGTRILIEVDLEDPDETPISKLNLQNEDTVFIDYSSVIAWRDILGIIAGPLAILSAILITVDRLSN